MMSGLTPPNNPKTFLKYIVSLSLILLVVWAFVMMQTSNTDTDSMTPSEQARVDSLRDVLGRENLQLAQGDEHDMGSRAVWVLIVLGGGLVIGWWFLRNRTPEPKEPWLNVLGEQDMGQGQVIKAVAFQDEVWILSVSSQQVSLLKEIPRAEFDESNVHQPKEMPKFDKSTFKKLFKQQKEKEL